VSTADVLCADERIRRAALLGHPSENGVDFLEVDASDLRLLHVHFLNPLPADAYDLPTELDRISIAGGTRVAGIRVVQAVRAAAQRLDVRVDRVGDFSSYVLELDAEELDPRFRRIEFSFRAGCPVDVAPTSGRDAPAPEPAPALDYLAKDYASFRRLLLDLAPQLNPGFVERNPADLGVALVELLAYAGDRLSYFQDAVANEAYLETARSRISVRRHARLVDYRLDEGANAQTFLHVAVHEGVVAGQTLPAASKAVTRIITPLLHAEDPPGAVLDADDVSAETLETDPALTGAAVFETRTAVACFEVNNELRIHAWGNDRCVVPEGATEAWLYAPRGDSPAVRPALQAGAFLLLEEARGPATGLEADADPTRRQVVELIEVADDEDELFAAALVDGELQLRGPTGDPLPLLRVRWRREDAVRAPFVLSRRDPDLGALTNLTVARGNIVPADHGITVADETAGPHAAVDARFRLRLRRAPLTTTDLPDGGSQPAVVLRVAEEGGGLERWTAVPDLLDSPPAERHFVAELDDDGRALLRFGDDEHGRSIAGATELRATYRVGSGRAGNVPADALAHLALPAALASDWIRSVRNPLPATGGRDPEAIDAARVRAPHAFRAMPLRAVTAADWVRFASELPDVQSAFAHLRWTGSWYAVVVALDPRSPADLVTGTDGRIRLEPGFEQRTRARLERFRLAGYDLELLAPTFVPLELEVEVCVAPGHFRTDVAAAVAEALSARRLADGRLGLFHPENLTFGLPVHASRIYGAVEAVPGVDTAVVRTFRRFGREDAGELESGVLPIAPGEIAQLENDPSFLEHGILRVVAQGGKA
jgi:hypothetical protein